MLISMIMWHTLVCVFSGIALQHSDELQTYNQDCHHPFAFLITAIVSSGVAMLFAVCWAGIGYHCGVASGLLIGSVQLAPLTLFIWALVLLGQGCQDISSREYPYWYGVVMMHVVTIPTILCLSCIGAFMGKRACSRLQPASEKEKAEALVFIETY